MYYCKRGGVIELETVIFYCMGLRFNHHYMRLGRHTPKHCASRRSNQENIATFGIDVLDNCGIRNLSLLGDESAISGYDDLGRLQLRDWRSFAFIILTSLSNSSFLWLIFFSTLMINTY